MYEKFATLLEEKQITAYQVAKDTGIGNATLSDWKHNVYTPKVDKLLILAHYFNVPLAYFLATNELITNKTKPNKTQGQV